MQIIQKHESEERSGPRNELRLASDDVTVVLMFEVVLLPLVLVVLVVVDDVLIADES